MKCSLGISDFLEEISRLSHSVVFLYFFALFAEEGNYFKALFIPERRPQSDNLKNHRNSSGYHLRPD